MTDDEMLWQVKDLVNEPRFDKWCGAYLEAAKAAVVTHLYPYAPEAEWADVPERYHTRTVEIAVYLVNRRGTEGEVQHAESGVSRSYESSNIPRSYFHGMVPFAGAPR